MRGGKLRIVLSGMIGGVPRQGGAAWAVLQYLLGFRRLGHEVFFLEQCEEESIRPQASPLARSKNAAYLRRVMASVGCEQSYALLVAGTEETAGHSYSRLCEVAGSADLLVNISGMLTDERLTGEIPARVYLDLDPAFTQVWHVSGIDVRLSGHTHFVSVGQAIGRSDCPIPTCGISWIPTLPPVSLEHWPRARRIKTDALTTIANWRGYGSIEHNGVQYGQKAHSLREFISLPTLTDEKFLLALAIHSDEKKDLEALAKNRWALADADEVAGTPAKYRDFVRGSKAEFGIAKSGYALSGSGWFSDRSACYLASGRPVIAQETGFSNFIPAGEGLFAFASNDGVLAALEELERDYPRHAHAARALAEEYLDSDKILSAFLDRVGAVT